MAASSSALTSAMSLMRADGCTMFPQREALLISRNVSTIPLSATTKENVTTKCSTCSRVLHIAPLKVVADSHSQQSIYVHRLEDHRQEAIKKIKSIISTKLEGCNVEELVMIDAIQRLGLECYFHDNIQAVLSKHYGTMQESDNLHDTALRFRLLRQHGYFLPAVETFNKFIDRHGSFRNELSKDIKGLISLFEGSHLSIPREHILDEAYEFSAHWLTNLTTTVEPSEARIIANILSNPYYKSLPRLMAANMLDNLEISLMFLHDCNYMHKWVSEVKHLARIDIDMAQISHQDEIAQVSRWWKELRLSEELQLARNQPAKWHMWSLVSLPGPDMGEQRILLTKAISLAYIIDDIFDVYGTLEDLTLFTEAVNRWDYVNVNELPDYMKTCLKALHDTTSEMSYKFYDKQGWNPENCLQKAWADLCNAFLTETRWFTSGHIPTTKEYLKNGIISTGLSIVYPYIFLLLGEGSDLKCTNLLSSPPDIASLGATILRLWDDLGSAKDENQSGHDGSYITCYMNEYNVSSTESAREHVFELISDVWKCLNETCLSPSPFSSDFKAGFLNLGRMVPIMYKYNDNHRLSSLEYYMKSVDQNVLNLVFCNFLQPKKLVGTYKISRSTGLYI